MKEKINIQKQKIKDNIKELHPNNLKNKIKDDVKNKIEKNIEKEDLKNNMVNLILSIGELIIGIILLITPLWFTKTIIILIGICLLILGIINIINYFKTNINEAIQEKKLLNGLISLTFGIFCTFYANWFINKIHILSIIYGIIILLLALRKIEWTINSFRLKRKYCYIILINSIISLMFSIIILNNSFKPSFIWKLTGIVLILEAIFDIMTITLDIRKDN